MQRPKISQKIKDKIRLLADNRCGYCLCRQEYVWDILEIDHIFPLAKGGKVSEENLWLICSSCNGAKYNKTEAFDSITENTVPIFNPRTQIWHEHFSWSKNGTKIIGKTAVGRATITAVNLNRERFIKTRKHWVSAGWHPPKD
jgi:5-methylcytosine-specific restriction endonuclease McrA